MANHKWMKWCVGVSSAALFVGLIGLNANRSDAANPSSSSSSSTPSASAQSTDQSTYDHQGMERGQQFENFNGYVGNDSSGTGNGSSDSGSGPQSDEFGGMRSHAS